MGKKVCILSIDGGGIRGILPGVIIAYLEERLQAKEGENVRISDYFDLLAGTSTGGILTCMYVAPDKEGKRPKFTAAEAVDLYFKNGGKIFNLPFFRKILNPFGIFEAKYPAKNIENILKTYLGDLKLSQALKPCLVTSYEIFQRKTMFFNKVDTLKEEHIRDFKLRDIARATSAAPTYFKPASIKSVYGAPYYLIDGGTFANNPSMCAYSEANTSELGKILKREDKPNYPTAKDMLLVSIGTGSHGDPYPYCKAKNWGVIGWLQPLINILMSGNSETVNYQLKHIFEVAKSTYYRLEPSVGTASSEMDLATQENMRALQEAGKTFVSNNAETLDEIVDLLIQNK